MTEFSRSYLLELSPIPPDNVSSVKEDISPLIEQALREVGQEILLTEGQIKVNVEQTFPTDAIIMAGVTLLTKVAYDVFTQVVLPKLKSRFHVDVRSKSAEDDKTSSASE